jgi:hypothetical protein
MLCCYVTGAEGAQEFLQFLVGAAHDEMVKLRSMLPLLAVRALTAAGAAASDQPLQLQCGQGQQCL